MAWADSRVCKARGQGQGQGIESCFYGLGLGVGFLLAWILGRALARGQWAWESLGKGFSKGGLQDLQKVCKNGAILRYNLRRSLGRVI